MSYVIAHDVGTSGLKTGLFDVAGGLLARRSIRYGATSPQPGWFEQDPDDYWRAAVANTRAVLDESGIDRSRVVGMAFSTQSMGVILVDAEGRVLHPNIAWVDGRAEPQARALMRRFGGTALFRWLVGTGITGKDVIPKLRWLRDERPGLFRQARHVLDVNGYLKRRATGRCVAEWSGACSYGFDLRRKDWERLFFRAAGVGTGLLPPLVRSVDAVGSLTPEAAQALELPRGVRVFGGCDDTQSAALGAGALGDGAGHLYLGSSAWAGVTTRRPRRHRHGAVCLQSADPNLCLVVGITESAGTHLEWFLERFYSTEAPAREGPAFQAFIDAELARVPPGSDHLIFTPWLQGERCPVSTTTDRGTLFNLGLEHTRAHLLRALLEGIAYNLRWILEQFRGDFGFAPPELRVVGGGASNDTWLQGIADITGRTVAAVEEPTFAGARGAAACALVGAGCLNGFAALESRIQVRQRFLPNPDLAALFAERFAAYQGVHFGLRNAYRRANAARFSAPQRP